MKLYCLYFVVEHVSFLLNQKYSCANNNIVYYHLMSGVHIMRLYYINLWSDCTVLHVYIRLWYLNCQNRDDIPGNIHLSKALLQGIPTFELKIYIFYGPQTIFQIQIDYYLIAHLFRKRKNFLLTIEESEC